MVDQDDYAYPVSALLSHGPLKAADTDEWFDYVGHYGFNNDDLPQLISLASETDLDPSNPSECCAPVHACRALGQLGDAAADIYLVKLLDDHKNLMLVETVLTVLCMLGPGSIRVLKQYSEWPEPSQESLVLVALGWFLIAQHYPQYRDECVQCLIEMLSEYLEQTPGLNGFIIHNLVQLQAKEASAVIEQAFQAGCVDEDINGAWNAVQVQLGLADRATTATTTAI